MSDTSLVFNILAKDKASATFNKLKGVAATAGVAIGAALTAGVASMLAKSKTDALLAAQLGSGTPAAAAAGKAAGQIYTRGVVESVEEANAAVRAAIQNALVPPDASSTQIDAVASKIANLSKVMEEDAGRVSAAVSQMIRTGMVKSAEEGFDLLQRGVEMGVNKSQDLLDTFNEYGTQFRKLGISGPYAMGLLSQAIRAGARDSDVAADALKEFSIRAVDGSKLTAQGFQMLGLDAKKMASAIGQGGDVAAEGLNTVLERLRAIKDPVKQSQAAVALFGTQAEDLGQALLAMNLDTANDEMGQLAGAADKAGQALEQSAGAKLDAFKRRAQTALVDTLAKAVPYVESTFGWLSRNSSWVVPLATGLGILAGVIYTIVTAMRIWAAVQTVLNLALWTSPITWIVAGILLLVGVIVLIATKTTWFQTAWNATWGAVKAAAAAVWGWLVSAAKAWWALFSGFWTGVGRFFASLWNGIVDKAKAAWRGITGTFDKVVGFVKGLPKRIGSAASGMWNGIKSSFRAAVNWIIGRWNGLSLTIGGGSILGMSIPSVTLHTPNIPYLAKGGTAVTAGLAVVGERGPELLNLPKGAQVTPLPSGGRGRGGGTGRGQLELVGERAVVEFVRRLIKQYNLLEA